MIDKISYSSFDTSFGHIFVAKTTKGVCLIKFSKITKIHFLSFLRKMFNKEAIRNDKALDNAKKSLIDYFNGRLLNFKIPLDLSSGTEFERKVWHKVREIPYGELRSYNWVAKAIGKAQASRAVGNAVGKNPVTPIIPCHRVVCSDGNLGGYTSGIAIKKRLLKLEGIAGF